MTRRPAALVLAAALAAGAVGCRSSCSNRGVLNSNARGDTPCQLVGSSKPVEGCFDAITGMPVPCPPSAGVIPGGTYPSAPGPAPGTRPDELPFPAPSDLIRPPGVPFAPPGAAPGDSYGANPRPATTTKTGR